MTYTLVSTPCRARRRRFSARDLILCAFWAGVLFLVIGVGLLNPREGLRIWNEAKEILP